MRKQAENIALLPRAPAKRVFVVAAGDDGQWCVRTAQDLPWSFSTQLEAEDYAIALALRAIPSVIRVQFKDGTLQREIHYE